MSKTKKKQANKGISRIDSGTTHGWFVRGYKNNRTFSKLFSDRKFGSKRKALDMAKEFRDQLHADLEKSNGAKGNAVAKALKNVPTKKKAAKKSAKKTVAKRKKSTKKK